MLVAAGLIGGLASGAGAQVGYPWTYEELLQQAHVVVIARCLATDDAGGRLSHPELFPDLPIVEMHTRFELQAVLRATDPSALALGTELRLRHFRLDRERWLKDHPPQPGMPPRALLGGVGALALIEGRSYLLFLTKPADGLYEPLSGFTFPGHSVVLLGGGL